MEYLFAAVSYSILLCTRSFFGSCSLRVMHFNQHSSRFLWQNFHVLMWWLDAQKTVITTKSVEFMPFFLSFFLFLNGGIWATYAVLDRDIFLGVSPSFTSRVMQEISHLLQTFLTRLSFFFCVISADPQWDRLRPWQHPADHLRDLHEQQGLPEQQRNSGRCGSSSSLKRLIQAGEASSHVWCAACWSRSWS